MAKAKSKTQDLKDTAREKKDDAFSLTTRQKEILKLVALGHTNLGCARAVLGSQPHRAGSGAGTRAV